MWPLLDLVTIKSFSAVYAQSSFGNKISILMLPPISSWALFTIIFPFESLACIIHRANLAFFISWNYLSLFKSINDIFKLFLDYFGRPFVVFSKIITTVLTFINSFLRQIASWAVIHFCKCHFQRNTKGFCFLKFFLG